MQGLTPLMEKKKIRCARNCFQCPICQNTLSVTASAETPSNVPSVLSMVTTGSPFYLTCGVCRWDSREIAMTFEKATGLACNYYFSQFLNFHNNNDDESSRRIQEIFRKKERKIA